MSLPVRNAIFDFGGVLIRWHPQEIIAGFYAQERLRRAALEAIFRHPDWIEMDRGSLDGQIAAERFATRMGRPASEMAALLAHVRESLTPIPETVAILRDLAGRGIACYGLSNMPAETFAHLRARYDFWDSFRGIIISGEVRMIKPDAEIFQHLADKFGLSYVDCVFIDDHPPNIEAARRLGMHAVLFKNPVQCAAELEAILSQ